MEIVYLITTFFAGIAVAFINTISGAGSLFSISAFMFVGMSAAEANATNRIPILVQSFFSAKGFESKGIKGDSYKWWLALACMPGAIAGSLFATKIESHILSRILAGVMLLFLFITLFNPLQQADEAEERVSKKYKVAGVIIHFFIGLYGGFIQAGSGFFMMAPLMLLNRFSLRKTNYYKVFITIDLFGKSFDNNIMDSRD